MSQENVEAVRRWFAAYNARDMDALVGLTHETFEMKSVFAGIETGGFFRGHAGFPFAYFEAIDDAYERFQVVGHEFIDAGAAVLVLGVAEWCGKESGAEGETPLFPVFWLRAQQMIRAETFTNRVEAFEAVGLSE